MGDIVEEECKKCGHCCRFGSGFVLDKEVASVAGSLGLEEQDFRHRYLEEAEMFGKTVFRFKILRNGRPFGPCIFQKGNLCSIHRFKPAHCRIGNCGQSGDEDHARFVIENFVDPKDPESIRQYHAYIKTGGLVPKGLEMEKMVTKKRLADILSFRIFR